MYMYTIILYVNTLLHDLHVYCDYVYVGESIVFPNATKTNFSYRVNSQDTPCSANVATGQSFPGTNEFRVWDTVQDIKQMLDLHNYVCYRLNL